MRNPFKRDTDDPLMRLFLDKYRLNLLSIPRENASLGDVYITDEKNNKFASPPGNIKYLLDPPFDFSKIKVTSGEILSDISGTASGSISAQFGLGFLENFLNALVPIVSIGTKIRADYEATGVRAVRFRFSSPTRHYIDDPHLLNVKLQRHKIAEAHQGKGYRYYLVTGVVRSSSISLIGENRDTGKVNVDLDIIANIAHGEAAISVERAGNGEVTFTGKRTLAFGVELYELVYDQDEHRLKFNTATNPLTLRRDQEAGETHTDIERTFIGDPKEGDVFIIIN